MRSIARGYANVPRMLDCSNLGTCLNYFKQIAWNCDHVTRCTNHVAFKELKIAPFL